MCFVADLSKHSRACF